MIPDPITSRVPGPFPPGHPDGPPLYPEMDAPPPGTVWRTAPDGSRYLDYVDQAAAAPAPVVALAQPMPGWAKGTALVVGVGSAGASAVALALSVAVDSLQALAHALWALAVMAAVVAVVVLGVVSAFRRPAGKGGPTTATATATATKRGLFGKSTATATAVAKTGRRR